MHEVGKTSSAPEMNTTQRTGTMQRWQVVQHALMLELRSEVVSLTPKLEKMVHTLGWMRIEEFIGLTWRGCERPEHDRGMLANALVSKAVLGLSTTAGLIERLAMDRALRRVCGLLTQVGRQKVRNVPNRLDRRRRSPSRAEKCGSFERLPRTGGSVATSMPQFLQQMSARFISK